MAPANGGNTQWIQRLFKREGVDLVLAQPHGPGGRGLVERAGGLFITGDAEHTPASAWQSWTLGVISEALRLDMPVLASGQGMFPLNCAFGGKPPKVLGGHLGDLAEGQGPATSHSIYLSPGSKSAAILGMGGFFKVNSRHREGLFDPQRSPRLLASAYSVEDGVVEGLESTEHSWVIGFQANIERQDEVPRSFGNIFLAFLERAEDFAIASGRP